MGCLISNRAADLFVAKQVAEDRLAVISKATVDEDVAFIRGLLALRTVGEARAFGLDAIVGDDWDCIDIDGAVDDHGRPVRHPHDEPFDFLEWFPDLGHLHLPDPAERTIQSTPEEVQRRFLQHDADWGFDYDPHDWLPLERRSEIEAALRALGHDVVADDGLLPPA